MSGNRKRPAFEAPSSLIVHEKRDPRMPRPAPITAGSVFVVLRALAGWLYLWSMWVAWPDIVHELELDDDIETSNAVFIILIAIVGAASLIDLVFAALVFRGVNWARILVMGMATLSISASFAAWWAGDDAVTLNTTLLTVALDILLMLALSSRRARAYSRRKE